jgi:hypothetical protein
MLTNSQKEHLTYTAIGQVVTLVALWIWTSSYILPGLDKIWVNIAEANTQIATYTTTEKNGLTFEEVSTYISSRPEYAELLKVMNADVAWTREVLAKTNPEKVYLEWIKDSIGSSTEERNAINQYKVKLNSIIPTLSPISGNTEEDTIDLKSYIRFIETKILKQFNLDANLVLGMQWITSGGNMPENIGSLELQISFKATNKNISDFISFINTAGNPELLTSTGILAKDKMPVVMSNPLITVKDFWLDKPINSSLPTEENGGRITLQFYMRGISKDDISYLKENIKIRNEELWKNIEVALEECKAQWALCGKIKDQLEALSTKYRQYNVSTSSTIAPDNVSQMYNLSKKVSTLKTLEEELANITETTSK